MRLKKHATQIQRSVARSDQENIPQHFSKREVGFRRIRDLSNRIKSATSVIPELVHDR
jgi:hypothetical protein